MPIPSAISDLSTTPSLNSPAGSESPALVDDYLRTHAAFIKQVNDESVKTSGNQTIAGTKTFSSPIAGSTTTQVSLTGNETIAGTKTFSSAPVVPGLSNSDPMTFTVNGAERMRVDASGNVLVTNNTGGLGYGTGAGGTVTQSTSKSTAVTLNRPTGQITMNNAALAAGGTVIFIVNNSVVTVIDNVLVTGVWGVSPAYRIARLGVGAGAFQIAVTNNTAGTLSEAVAINFAIIKGATS